MKPYQRKISIANEIKCQWLIKIIRRFLLLFSSLFNSNNIQNSLFFKLQQIRFAARINSYRLIVCLMAFFSSFLYLLLYSKREIHWTHWISGVHSIRLFEFAVFLKYILAKYFFRKINQYSWRGQTSYCYH